MAALRNFSCSFPFISSRNNVAAGRWVMPSNTKNPRSNWGWLNGQSWGSVITINKVSGTNNIILNNDFENCLQRFFSIFLYKWLYKKNSNEFQRNSSLAITAVLYHRWGHLDLAKKHYEISLQLDPTASGTKENYGLLRRKLEQMQKKDVWSFFLHFFEFDVCMHETYH